MLRNIMKHKAILLLGASMLLVSARASALVCDDDQQLVVRPNGSEYCQYVGDDYYYDGAYAPYFLPFVGYYGGWGWGGGDEDVFINNGGHHNGHWDGGHGYHDGYHGEAHGGGAVHSGGGMHGGGFHGGGSHGGHH